MPLGRLIVGVLLPFAAGYHLSYVFRTINALIVDQLSEEIGISPAALGLLTSMYFLVMVAVQLPIGALLDRHGPRRLQVVLLPITALGAVVFALADSVPGLLIGRLLIGTGVSAALMAGLKAASLWFPPERIGMANGLLVMAGSLGAVMAAVPIQALIGVVGWRPVFLLLAVLATVAAVTILVVVPRVVTTASKPKVVEPIGLRTIFSDARFWRLAPMSAASIGTSWAIQGLWAAPWLTDVEGFDHATVVRHLVVMAVALCVSAISLGAAADRLRRRGIRSETLLAATAIVFMLAQLVIVLRWPIPSYLSWTLIAAAGAGTVLSYAILPGYFPKAASARANAALNLLHLSVAFAVQWLTGVVVDQWSGQDGRHPAEAYQAAFGINLAIQALAFTWFVVAGVRATEAGPMHQIPQCLSPYRARPQRCPYSQAHMAWLTELSAAQRQMSSWRGVAIASMALCIVLTSLAIPGQAGLSHLAMTGTPQSFAAAAHEARPGLPPASRELPPIPIALRSAGTTSSSTP
jgi:predicted MFS family arabinose efflux permease